MHIYVCFIHFSYHFNSYCHIIIPLQSTVNVTINPGAREVQQTWDVVKGLLQVQNTVECPSSKRYSYIVSVMSCTADEMTPKSVGSFYMVSIP